MAGRPKKQRIKLKWGGGICLLCEIKLGLSLPWWGRRKIALLEDARGKETIRRQGRRQCMCIQHIHTVPATSSFHTAASPIDSQLPGSDMQRAASRTGRQWRQARIPATEEMLVGKKGDFPTSVRVPLHMTGTLISS